MFWNKFGSSFRRINLLESYNIAISWIRQHSTTEGGVSVSSKDPAPYPEVTGYLIPTLIEWGERDLACSYARWLCSIQNIDGSWSDPGGKSPYTFDTGQILKGLVALLDILPDLEKPVRRGCDWLLTQIKEDGRVVTPDTSQWSLPGNNIVPEAIHLYALVPLRSVGERFGNQEYLDVVSKSLDYYCADPVLTSFTTLSHFHAYIIEALIDLGRRDLAEEAMKGIRNLQKKDGSIPAYSNVRWVCSVGLFQYALVWYKLGNINCGNSSFTAALKLQNSSGGFFGSYGRGANYFPQEEVSWAVKYFLDSLWWKIRTSFDEEAIIFPESIKSSDGRYELLGQTVRQNSPHTVLEVGCGKGRFLLRLHEDFPEIKLYGLDISKKMLAALPAQIVHIYGSLLNISVPDGCFELVYCIEALEHAVNINGAIKELCRVVKPGGVLVIIDKNLNCLGNLKISEWEQWFDALKLSDVLQQNGFMVKVEYNIPYDDFDGCDGLFIGWVATKIDFNSIG